MKTINREEALNWGTRFIGVWEANITEKMNVEIYDLFNAVNLTAKANGVRLLLDLFYPDAAVTEKRNSYTDIPSTDVRDIEKLNLSAISVARILAHYGAHKAVINNRPLELFYCEGSVSELRGLNYRLTIREEQ